MGLGQCLPSGTQSWRGGRLGPQSVTKGWGDGRGGSGGAAMLSLDEVSSAPSPDPKGERQGPGPLRGQVVSCLVPTPPLAGPLCAPVCDDGCLPGPRAHQDHWGA